MIAFARSASERDNANAVGQARKIAKRVASDESLYRKLVNYTPARPEAIDCLEKQSRPVLFRSDCPPTPSAMFSIFRLVCRENRSS